MFSITPAFLAGLNAGLAAPISLYSPTPVYVVDARPYAPAACLSAVASLVRNAAVSYRPIG